MSPPSLVASPDQFQWRKEIIYWIQTITACAKVGDSRCKGLISAMGDLVSLSQLRKAAESREICEFRKLILYPTDFDAPDDKSVVVENIISIVATDSSIETI